MGLRKPTGRNPLIPPPPSTSSNDSGGETLPLTFFWAIVALHSASGPNQRNRGVGARRAANRQSGAQAGRQRVATTCGAYWNTPARKPPASWKFQIGQIDMGRLAAGLGNIAI